MELKGDSITEGMLHLRGQREESELAFLEGEGVTRPPYSVDDAEMLSHSAPGYTVHSARDGHLSRQNQSLRNMRRQRHTQNTRSVRSGSNARPRCRGGQRARPQCVRGRTAGKREGATVTPSAPKTTALSRSPFVRPRNPFGLMRFGRTLARPRRPERGSPGSQRGYFGSCQNGCKAGCTRHLSADE